MQCAEQSGSPQGFAAVKGFGMSSAGDFGVIIGGLVGIGLVFFWIWLVVVAVQFLRMGTQAFRRYLEMTTTQVRAAAAWPGAGQAPGEAPRGY